MKTFDEVVAAPETEGLFEMANISPKRTGLPFVVWLSPKAGAPYDVRVKVSRGPRVQNSELVSVAIRLNFDVIVRYWDGDIEYAQDAIALLKPIH